MFLLLKHIDRPDILDIIDKLGYIFSTLVRMGEKDLLKLSLVYLVRGSDHKFNHEIVERIKNIVQETEGKEAGDHIMEFGKGIYSTALKEGYTKGRVEGHEEGWDEHAMVTAQKMIERGYNLEDVSEISGLSSSAVLELKSSMGKAD